MKSAASVDSYTVYCPCCGKATQPSKRNGSIFVCRNRECPAYAD